MFTGVLWRRTPLECSTHAPPAHEAFVLPMEKKGKDGSSKIPANATLLFSFSVSLLRSYCGVQLFSDDEGRCSGSINIIRRYRCCILTTAKRCRPC